MCWRRQPVARRWGLPLHPQLLRLLHLLVGTLLLRLAEILLLHPLVGVLLLLRPMVALLLLQEQGSAWLGPGAAAAARLMDLPQGDLPRDSLLIQSSRADPISRRAIPEDSTPVQSQGRPSRPRQAVLFLPARQAQAV